MVILLTLLGIFFSLLPLKVWALTPDRVLIVANKNSSVSRMLAYYYQRVRRVPEENLVLLSLPAKEAIARTTYVKKLERPLMAYLKKHHLEDQILAMVLMPDVPLKIQGRVARDGDAASVDSELTLLYRKMLYGPYRLGGWLPNPFFNAPLEQDFEHDRFDIYMVTRIAAYTPAQAKALIKRALKAPYTKPPYTLILDARAGAINPGDNWLYATYLKLRNKPGLILQTSFGPEFITQGQRVIGYASWGSNDPRYPPNRKLALSFLPGAIGVTYVSTSARTFHPPPPHWQVGSWKERWKWYAGSPQSLIADLIKLGLTGISGNVYEPYLAASARPYILFPAYLNGQSLAEAYYRSLAYLSWQTVVVGDPLCCLKDTPQGPVKTIKPWFSRHKKAFERALRRNTIADRLFLAKVYLKQGFFLKAFGQLRPLLNRPEVPRETYSLLFVLAQDKIAARQIKKALEQVQDPQALLLRGFLYLRGRNWSCLKRVLEELETQGLSKAFEVRYLKAFYLLETNHAKESIALFEGLIATKPGDYFLYLPLLKALKEAGEKKRLSFIRKKLLEDPSFVELWPALRNFNNVD